MGFFSFDNNSRGGFMSSNPAIKNIIIINVLVMIMISINQLMMMENFALFYPKSRFFHIWQPVTYLFLHGNFAHLLFNMYTLYIFGTVLERVWGAKKFLIFYFVTGIGAALVQMGVQWFQIEALTRELAAGQLEANAKILTLLATPTVGASGAIYGVLMGYAMLYPDSILRLLFPPIALKAKWFVLIFGAIELLIGISGSNDGVAHFAHLGGLVFGFILIKYWKKQHRLYGDY